MMKGIKPRKGNPQEMVWESRDTTSTAIRKDPFVASVFKSADFSGVKGDTRFVVLAAALINDRRRIINDRNQLFEERAEMVKAISRLTEQRPSLKDRLMGWITKLEVRLYGSKNA